MNYESILVRKEGKVITIVLNRPQSLNFLDPIMAEEMARLGPGQSPKRGGQIENRESLGGEL